LERSEKGDVQQYVVRITTYTYIFFLSKFRTNFEVSALAFIGATLWKIYLDIIKCIFAIAAQSIYI
jgi:hypothetical protein